MFPVNVPRKTRTPRSHPSPSSMATTPWKRVIEKQRSVELQNPETSLSSCFAESKGVGPSSSSSSRPLEEELRIQQNPNLDPSFTINVSKQEEERSTRKKRKLELLPRDTPPPQWLVDVMRESNGYDPKLIIAKEMFQSDLDPGQKRLSMPLNQVVNKDFLTDEESTIIYQQSEMKTRREGVSVVLVDTLKDKHVVNLRKWRMSEGWNYVLVGNWNNVVAENKFEVRKVYHVWSFRSGTGQLHFAIGDPPSPTTNSSQDEGSTSVVESIGHAKDSPAESMVLTTMESDDHLFGDLTHLGTLSKDSGCDIDSLPNINEFDDIDSFILPDTDSFDEFDSFASYFNQHHP